MRASWCALVGAVCFAAISQVSGATTLKFTGASGPTENAGGETVYVYPYNFSVNGSSTTTQLICLNFNEEITQGESWTVNVDTISQAANGNSTLLKDYEEDAWLYSQITPSSSKSEDALIQFAVWDVLDSSVANSHDPFYVSNSAAINNLLTEASNAIGGESASFFDQFQVYVPNEPNSYYNKRDGYPDGVPQTFMGMTPDAPPSPSPTLEPGSLALLGTGLMGLGGVFRSKMRKA